MKPVQVMMDPELLQALDSTPEVQREGRSAVLRTAVREYLERRRRSTIHDQYVRAYASDDGLGPDYAGWDQEGVWPE